MDYKIEIRPLAALETVEAYDWYEQQREGLGLKFLADLDCFYSLISQHPHIYSYYEKPIRQGLLDKFPYQVVHEVFDDTIVIYSVFMARQNPIKKRTS